jgi:hypothetical protein
VEGGPPELGNGKVLRFDGRSSVPISTEDCQYADILIDDERLHLDRFAEHLKAKRPESIGYITKSRKVAKRLFQS